MELRKSGAKTIFFFLLVILGILGNSWHVSLLFGVVFLFGGIASFILLIALGPRLAILATVLIAGETYLIWHHFYVALVLVGEIAFVGFMLKKARYNLTLATGIYWLIIGIPTVLAFFYFDVKMSFDGALLAAIKQAINEIFNAVVASLLLEHTPLSKLSFLRMKRQRSVFQTVFNIFVAAAIIPSFIILVLNARKVVEQVETATQARLETLSGGISLFSARWREQHQSVVQLVARLVESMKNPTPKKLQYLLQEFRASSPDFESISIWDANGKVVALDPLVNAEGEGTLGKDFSDRSYFQALKSGTRTVSMDPVFLSKGGIVHPLITINAAILTQGRFRGIVSSALSLDHLTDVLNMSDSDRDDRAVIIDSQGRIISSNYPLMNSQTSFVLPLFDPNVTLHSNNFYHRWPSDPGLTPMDRWGRSTIGLMTPLTSLEDWKLYVEIPLADQRDAVFHQYVRAMSMLLVLILLILLASQWLAALIGDPLARLSSQTTNLPERLTSKATQKNILWPNTEFIEIRSLIENFKAMSLELKRRFAELEQASRMKDEFLATLSHELRTPLNVILGHASLLKQEAAENKDGRIPSFETSIEAIARNASVQNQLVSDLLDISAIITGKISFQPKIVSLTELARSVVESVRLSAEARGVRLSLHLTECPCTVLGDPTRLHQVIWNLLSNAIKFTPRDGQVTLKVFSEPIDGEKLSVIEVIDTGRGIDPDFLPHLFERFRQEDSTTTRQYGGLGLGLSIVRHIVELHGGTAQAFSEGKDRGARFRITFPFANARAESVVEAARPETRENLEGLHLLVVDDDRDSRDLMSFVLQKAGARVDTANSTREALEKCGRTEFDVVISDIGLPDEDGYTLIRKLRSDSRAASRERPAIALTAYAREEDRQKSLASGFQSYLSKPVDVKKLIQMIRELAP